MSTECRPDVREDADSRYTSMTSPPQLFKRFRFISVVSSSRLE